MIRTLERIIGRSRPSSTFSESISRMGRASAFIIALLVFVCGFEESAYGQLQGSAGNVRVNVEWTGNVDLDTYVTDPCNQVIGIFENKNVRCQGFVGELDHDDEGHGYQTDNPNAENIVWTDGAPIGRYSVYIVYYIGSEAADYTIRIYYGTQEEIKEIHRGRIGPAEIRQRRHVTDFEADESVNFPVASFALSSSGADEGSGIHNVTVNLSPTPQSNVTLRYTLGGTAEPGNDYGITGVTGLTGTVEASVGADTVDIPVRITDDNALEGNETILLTLTEGAGYTVESSNAHTVTIADDDMRSVTLSTSTLSVVEGQHSAYSVRLASRPDNDDNVVVTPRSDNPHISFTPSSLAFDTENWNAPQQMSFLVTDDNQHDSLTINHGVSGYGDLTDGGTVTVNVVPSTTVAETKEKALVEDTVKAVAASAVANVSANIGARFSGSPGGAAPTLTLAGVPVYARANSWSGEELSLDRDGVFGLWNEAEERRPRVWNPSMTDLLRGSAFQVALGAAESGAGLFSGVTMWGRGDMVRLESDTEKEGSYDGVILAGYLGLDKRVTNQWTLGVAASRIGVSADYALEDGSGELELNLTGVHPYARFVSAQGTELSIILGWSTGEIENVREGAAGREATDTRLFMAGAGGRRKAVSGILGGMDVTLLWDVGYGKVSGESDDTLETLDDLMIDTLRVRGGVEGSYTKELETGATLTPFVELAGRYDGGSGDDSTGMEVAGGVTYAVPTQGLGLQARAYALVLSSRSDYREYGASATVSMTSQQRGQGLSVSVTPRLGRPGGDADALWRNDPFAVSGQSQEPEFALDARVEYGVAGLEFGGTVTPFTELQWLGDDRRRVRTGVRIGRMALAGRGLDLRFYGERTTQARDDAEDRINILANWRF